MKEEDHAQCGVPANAARLVVPVRIEADTSCRDSASTAEMEKSMSLQIKRPSASVSAMFAGFTALDMSGLFICQAEEAPGERTVTMDHAHVVHMGKGGQDVEGHLDGFKLSQPTIILALDAVGQRAHLHQFHDHGKQLAVR